MLKRVLRRIRNEQDADSLRRSGAEVGERVFVGRGVIVDGSVPWLVSIGDYATIGPRAIILTHDAAMRRISGWGRVAPVRIGTRAFVGAGAIVLPGVTIGDRAIVGAGSVVTHDVPAGTVAVGNPARVQGTVEQVAEQQRREMEELPVYKGAGWTVTGHADEAARDRMVRELAGRHGFIE